jgi:A/G-specific adenine glycosylase
VSSFASRLVAWQRIHGRHDLPWQGGDAYRVWLSEVMLQQTQVAVVIPYYQRFVSAFPNIVVLAAATEEQVLSYWSGLGYYARARNLRRAANIIVEKYQGDFPRGFEQILALPGIGRSTAAAICALVWNERRSILDGNVKRILARHCGISCSRDRKGMDALLWEKADSLLPEQDIGCYVQAQMDLGALICTRAGPKCRICPIQTDCFAFHSGQVHLLPKPRQRTRPPEKKTVLVLLTHDGEILLEKRPSPGIWGGLWSLPQQADEASAEDWCRKNGLVVVDWTVLETVTHTFTHFKLHITPVRINLKIKPRLSQRSGGVWMTAEDALRAAIPAPVRALLSKYCQSPGEKVTLPTCQLGSGGPLDDQASLPRRSQRVPQRLWDGDKSRD